MRKSAPKQKRKKIPGPLMAGKYRPRANKLRKGRMTSGRIMAAQIRERANTRTDAKRKVVIERAAQIVEARAKVPAAIALIDFRQPTEAERKHARSLESLARECRARNAR
jgi:hypothetical protein